MKKASSFHFLNHSEPFQIASIGLYAPSIANSFIGPIEFQAVIVLAIKDDERHMVPFSFFGKRCSIPTSLFFDFLSLRDVENKKKAQCTSRSFVPGSMSGRFRSLDIGLNVQQFVREKISMGR